MEDYLFIALVLVAVGVILLVAEILLPTGGFLIVGALLFFAAGVGTILYYGDTLEAVVAVAGLAVGMPASIYVGTLAWRRLSINSSLEAEAEGAALPKVVGVENLKGRTGKTVSPMRPSGTVDFDGNRVDAMTEGMMLDSGVWVKCVDVKGGKVIVRQMDTPAGISDINLDGPNSGPDLDLDLDIDKP